MQPWLLANVTKIVKDNAMRRDTDSTQRSGVNEEMTFNTRHIHDSNQLRNSKADSNRF